jgi:tetratricopeptide (TPR) repeat protein
MVVLLIVFCVLAFRKRMELVGAGCLWLLLFLLPFSNLVPMMQYCAERFLYLPLVGFIVALTAAMMLMRQRRVAFTTAVAVVLLWTILAWNRSWIWRDPVTLFVQTHIDGPTSPRVQDNAIAAVMSLPHMRAVFRPVHRPGKPIDLVATAPAENVNWPAIDKTLHEIRTILPDNGTVSGALAIGKALQGDSIEAIKYFELAVKQRPDNAAYWSNLGHAYAEAGRLEEAETALSRALSLDPDSIPALQTLANLQWQRKDYSGARRTLERLRKLDPNYPEHARRSAEAGRRVASL